MPLRNFRRRADAVRSIPLETVLMHWGAERDRRDRNRWHTGGGPVSVTGSKFFNWHFSQGGGGAIDLVMHLGAMDAAAAVQWLERHLGAAATVASPSAASPSASGGGRSATRPSVGTASARELRLPVADAGKLDRVRRYLTQRRGLSAEILEPLIEAEKVYADGRGNAVFVMVAGKPNRAIGAELRGTGQQVWHGLAPGTRKDAGYFWVGSRGAGKIVLCESAIDAISCYQLHVLEHQTPCLCISTAGVRPDARWLSRLLAGQYEIYCGFDTDEAGEQSSEQMIARHPCIRRLPPPAHDWNAALLAVE